MASKDRIKREALETLESDVVALSTALAQANQHNETLFNAYQNVMCILGALMHEHHNHGRPEEAPILRARIPRKAYDAVILKALSLKWIRHLEDGTKCENEADGEKFAYVDVEMILKDGTMEKVITAASKRVVATDALGNIQNTNDRPKILGLDGRVISHD